MHLRQTRVGGAAPTYNSPFLRPTVPMAPEGADDGGGDGKGQGELKLPAGDGDGGDGDAAAAEAERRVKAAEERAAKLEAAEKRRQAALKAEADKKRVEEGEAKKVIAEKDERIRAAEERLAALEARHKEQADKVFASLPKANQKAIEKFKDRLSVDDWADLVQAQVEIATPKEGDAPKGKPSMQGPPDSDISGGTGAVKLQPETEPFLTEMGMAHVLEHFKDATVKIDPKTLNKKVSHAFSVFKKKIGKTEGLPMSIKKPEGQ